MSQTYLSNNDLLVPDRPYHPRISLRAVFSGVVVALIVQIMLMALGAAIGLTAFNADAAQELGVGGLVWLLLSLCLSSFFGAWVAATVAQTQQRRDGALNGLVTWATVSLLGLFLVTSTLTTIGSGAFGLVSRTAQVAAQAPPGSVPDTSSLGQEIERQAGQVSVSQEQAEGAVKKAGIGMWGLFAAHLLPMLAAIGGGLMGAKSEQRLIGRRRDVIVRRDRDRDVVSPIQPQPTT
jgi:hypothetical protein